MEEEKGGRGGEGLGKDSVNVVVSKQVVGNKFLRVEEGGRGGEEEGGEEKKRKRR